MILKKYKKQYFEFDGTDQKDFLVETVDGQHKLHRYITGFYWEETKFPKNTKIAKTLENMMDYINQIDEKV